MIHNKMTVRFLVLVFTLALTDANDPTQIEKYEDKIKTYKLDVPGKDPITIIETQDANRWKDMTIDQKDKPLEIKNLMTHIIHDLDGNKPRCYGPSCQQGYVDESFRESDEGIEDFEDYMLAAEKLKDFNEFPQDRLQAITALAAKLKKEKLKNRYPQIQIQNDDEDDNSDKVMTSWNRLKVKQHKHPFDDKDGWVSLEPVAWSTSKISKWKPNVKKQKPNHWQDEEDRFPNDDNDSFNSNNGNRFSYTQKKPVVSRPTFINNKLHVPQDYDSELPSRPSWTKPQQSSPMPWSPDEGRRPHKPNCDHDDHYQNDEAVYYGISDSVVTDNRPSNFPYEYEALHQASSSKRPIRRPTQVVYAGAEYEDDRSSRPPYGDGQWVLLSTTKGYRNKKRQRSLNPNPDDRTDVATVTSHQAVALTVLPADNTRKNMTTSHGGMLEVEKSFQTVEESKRDMDKRHDLSVSSSVNRPVTNRVRRKFVSNVTPDSSTLLTAVGAGMVPATMAMVVPMMLGRRRRRDIQEELNLDNIFRNY